MDDSSTTLPITPADSPAPSLSKKCLVCAREGNETICPDCGMLTEKVCPDCNQCQTVCLCSKKI